MKNRCALSILTAAIALLVFPAVALANPIGDIIFGRFGGIWGFIWGLVLIIGLPGAILLAVAYVLRSR